VRPASSAIALALALVLCALRSAGAQEGEGEDPAEGDYAEETDDLAGVYGVTPFVVPNNTPVGSRTEAMLSSYLLDRHHGRENQPLREQILRSMRFALRQQVRPDSEFAWPVAAQPLGAITAASTSPVVRIDYVQHICSAMMRTAAILDPGISRATSK